MTHSIAPSLCDSDFLVFKGWTKLCCPLFYVILWLYKRQVGQVNIEKKSWWLSDITPVCSAHYTAWGLVIYTGMTDLKNCERVPGSKIPGSPCSSQWLISLTNPVLAYPSCLGIKVVNWLLFCNRLHQQIMDIGGNKLKAVQSLLDMINGRIDQTTGLKNKANVAVKTAKRYNFYDW